MKKTGTLVKLEDLSAGYASRPLGIFGKTQRKAVLDRVNLEIRRGELFGLVGESGSGKTTLARCILGLAGYQGRVLIDGLAGDGAYRERRSGRERRERARKVQAVFQDPAAALNPVKSIGWILEEPLRAHRLGSKAWRLLQVDRVLRLTGLDPAYRSRLPHELSGGQKQRVCIACALLLDPELLIADEAVSSLDVSAGAQILNLFRDLHDELGLAVLFISHNHEAVRYLCGRVAVMRSGQVIEAG